MPFRQSLRGRSAAYIAHVITEKLLRLLLKKLADAVDAFCEGIAFSPEEVDRLFTAARVLAWTAVKTPCRPALEPAWRGARGAKHGALSADHLEYTMPRVRRRWPKAGTVAVLLPGAFYFLREKQLPPIAEFRRPARAWRSRPIAIPAPRR